MLNNLEHRNPTLKNITLGARKRQEAIARPQTAKFAMVNAVPIFTPGIAESLQSTGNQDKHKQPFLHFWVREARKRS